MPARFILVWPSVYIQNVVVLFAHYNELPFYLAAMPRAQWRANFCQAMQSTSRPAADEAFPDTHLTACDLHCSGATAAWHAMLIMLHRVTGGPTMSHGIEI